MHQKGSQKGTVIALVALALLLAAALAGHFISRAKANPGEKNITVQVIHGDGSQTEFQLKTDVDFLGDALTEGSVVEGKQTEYGLYIITADGETADETKQEWWSVSKDGVPLEVGADSQAIADREHYELTFTVGYDF